MSLDCPCGFGPRWDLNPHSATWHTAHCDCRCDCPSRPERATSATMEPPMADITVTRSRLVTRRTVHRIRTVAHNTGRPVHTNKPVAHRHSPRPKCDNGRMYFAANGQS